MQQKFTLKVLTQKASDRLLQFQTDTTGKCIRSLLKATFDESVYLNHYHH